MLPKLFVIIVTYKGHQWYERCFTSLRNSEYPVQTIVIDNASNDGTVEYIREHFSEIHLIESKENLGFGRANNIGMRYALDHGCDYVFLLNQDAWVELDTLTELVRVAEKYTEYGVLSPMHMNKEKDHLNMSLDDGKGNYELLSDVYCHSIRDVYATSSVNAAAWLLPRKTLEIIGGFCPLFFYCGEDDDYMNRLKYHKLPMGVCPKARIVHDTKIKLDQSKALSQKALNEDLHNLLNINSSDPYTLLLYHIKKGILASMRFNRTLMRYHYQKMRYLILRKKELTSVRKVHQNKDAHWL